MTLAVVWLAEANAELKEALYASIRPELAQRFAEAVQDTVGCIADGPLSYAVVD